MRTPAAMPPTTHPEGTAGATGRRMGIAPGQEAVTPIRERNPPHEYRPSRQFTSGIPGDSGCDPRPGYQPRPPLPPVHRKAVVLISLFAPGRSTNRKRAEPEVQLKPRVTVVAQGSP